MTLPKLKRPLRPFFLHPSTSSPPQIALDPPYTPIICLSVSRWVGITGQQYDDVPAVTRVGERNVGYEYVPGAGDDDELWAKVCWALCIRDWYVG
jgi:tRNA A64-2'-O-ribosylphosphate transferase